MDTSYYVTVDTSNWGTSEGYSDATGTFTVTGNSFSQTSGYAIPGVGNTGPYSDGQRRYSISSLTIEAWVVITGITICTSSRSFLVDFSGTSTTANTNSSINCLQAPFSTNSGTTVRSLNWNVPDVNLGTAPGGGRIRVRGAGSIGTWSTSPDQRIRVRVNITGSQQRWNVSSRQDLVPASRTDTYYY